MRVHCDWVRICLKVTGEIRTEVVYGIWNKSAADEAGIKLTTAAEDYLKFVASKINRFERWHNTLIISRF